jgi:uncharacterized protein YjbI with pentapeptide repeats
MLPHWARRRLATTITALAAATSMVSLGLYALPAPIAAAAPPPPVITGPANPSTLSSPTVDVTGTASGGAAVSLFDQGSPIATTTAAESNGDWSVLVTLLQGQHTLTAEQSSSGQSSPPSSSVAVTVTTNQLVGNGTFATPVAGSGAGWEGYTWENFASPIAGPWYEVDALHSGNNCGIELQTEATGGVTPYDGETQYVELASNCVSGIKQTLSTVPGTSYTVSFAYRGRPGTALSENTMAVSWGGTYITPGTDVAAGSGLQGQPSLPDSGADSWQTATYTETGTANSSSTVIEFDDTNPDAPDSYGDFLDDVSVVAVTPPGLNSTIANATISATNAAGNSTVAAVQSVPDSAVPASALSTAPASGAGDATAAELSSTPLSTAPIGQVLVQNLPLVTIAGYSGSGDPGLAAAAQNLDQIPLSELDLSFTPAANCSPSLSAATGASGCGGWGEILAGSPFAGAPLDGVTLGEVLMDQSVDAVLNSFGVTLGDLGLGGSALGTLPISSVLLANTPLNDIPLTPGSTNPLSDWCTALAQQGSSCARFGILPGASSTTVTPLVLGLAGIELSSTELSSTELSSTELSSTELSSTELDNISLSGLELSSTELSSTPMDAIELSSTELSSTGLGSLTLNDIELSSTELSSTELSSTPLEDLELSSTPLGGLPLSSTELSSTGVGGIELSSTELSSTELSSTPLSAIIPGELSHVVTCGTSCIATTLGQAYTDGELQPGLTLGELYAVLSDAATTPGFSTTTIAELALIDPTYAGADLLQLLQVLVNGSSTSGWAQTTLADLYQNMAANASGQGLTLGDLLASLVDGANTPGWAGTSLGQLLAALSPTELSYLTLADIMTLLEPPTSYPWQAVDLADVPLAQGETANPSNTEDYSVDVNATSNQAATVQVTVDLPPTFAYLAGSATVSGPTSEPQAPTSTSPLIWSLAVPQGASSYVISFAATAGIDLGTALATVSASVGSWVSTGSADATVADGEQGHNDASTPTPLGLNDLNLGYIDSPTDIDDWSVTLTQNSQELALYLSNLPADYDLELFGPAQPTLAGTTTPGQQLAPVTDTVPALDPAGTIEATPGSQDLPVTPPPGDCPASGTGQGPCQLYALGNVADEASLYSTDSGTQSIQTPPVGPGTYIVQVSGYNGAYSPQPYLLRAQVLGGVGNSPSCNVLPFTPLATGQGYTPTGSPPAIPAGTNTLYLINTQRFEDEYGTGDLSQVESDISATNTVNGVQEALVPVDDYPAVQTAYQTWDSNPCSVSAANGVVTAITGVVNEIRAGGYSGGTAPNITSIVIIGADDEIPFARLPDGTVANNERDYASQTFADENNVEADALGEGYYFSDDPYAASSAVGAGGATMYLPTTAVGRLIETPAEIETALTTFSNARGVISSGDGLATGYDDFSTGATDIAANLKTAGLDVKSLINSDQTPVADDWTKSDLTSAIQAEQTPSVDSINAHFDFGRALPSVGYYTNDDSDLYTTNDVAGDPTAYAGDLLFSVGCHAGLDIDTAEVAQSDIGQTADWATTFAQAGAVWLANTGYGYMDSNTVAYSVALMTDFSADLSQPVSIGQALAAAEQQYAGGNTLLSPYELKSMMESTLYGLPMYTLNTSALSGSSFTPLPTSIDSYTGLASTAVTVSLPYTAQAGDTTLNDLSEQTGTNSTDYFQVNGASNPTTSVEYRPVEPQTSVNVSEPGNVAHGALVTALTSTDITPFTPTVSQPEVAFVSTPAASSSAFPGTIQRVATEQDFTLTSTAQTVQLDLVAGQYLPSSSTPGEGTQRLFTNIGAQVFYTSPNSLLANDFTPPTVQTSSAVTQGSSTSFTVTTQPGVSAAQVDEVLVLYAPAVVGSTTPVTWTQLELKSTNGSTWTGTASVAPGQLVQYMVEAVDAAGNVGVSDNNGSDFSSVQPPVIQLNGTQNASTLVYTGPVTASVTPSPSTADPMTYQLDDGAIQPLTSSTPIAITGDGTHQLVVTDSAGLQATSKFVIDTGGPVISTSTSTMPSNGWVAPGTTLTVNVADPSGAAVRSVTYSASGANPMTAVTKSGTSLSLPFIVSGFSSNGATEVTISATDANDVTVTETVPVDVDDQAPSLSCTEPSPNTEGWFTNEVEVTCTATDNESGIAPNTNVYSNYSTSSATVELWTTVSPGSSSTKAPASVGGSTTVTACNAFGQCATAGPFSFQVDLTTPSVVVSSPSQDLQYNLGQKVAATFSCADANGSGVSSCTANVISSVNANSIAVTNGSNVPTSSSGAYTFTATAVSNAGVPESQVVNYSVLQALPTLTFSGMPDPAVSGAKSITYSVVVSGQGVTPTGKVTITAVAGGSCTISALSSSGAGSCSITEAVGAYAVTAAYGGNSNYTPATAVVGETVANCGGSTAGCNLTKANLENANLSGVNFSGDNMSSANLSGADLANANLSGDNLSSVNFTGADLANANLSGANMSGDILTGANLTDADLAGNNLSSVQAQGAVFTGANLKGDNLKGGAFNGDNFVGAGLQGDNLSGGNFTNALFDGDNLSGSNMSDAEFSGANLTNTDLAGANLSGSDLTKADTDGADTQGANLNGITWSNTICPDGTNSGSTHDKGTCVNDQ